MKEYEYKMEKVQVEKSITCNKCGKQEQIEGKEDVRLNTFQTFKIDFGYGSQYDEQIWKFDLCEECLTEFVQSFKYLAEGFNK